LKCEIDLSGNEELVSFSLGRDWNNNSVPTTGEEVYSELSAGQLRLLDSAKIAVFRSELARDHDVDILCPYPPPRNQEDDKAFASVHAEHAMTNLS
jgi:hypothetical protein